MAGLHGRAVTVDLGRPSRNGTHTRQPSDIDSLSPEVVAALQSTFGGKLNELRSQSSLQKQKPSPLQPPAKETVDSENEGTFLVVAYVAGILASILILVTAGGKTEEDMSCRRYGDSRCVRLYGCILPIGVTGISLIFALVLSVFDVSFGVYNVLKTTENFFVATTLRLSDFPQAALAYILDIGFVAVAISLLWLAKASTVDPLFTLCEEGVKVYWMFGLITMGTVIFWCAAKSTRDPASTHLFMKRAAKIVTVLLLFFGASSVLYNIAAPPQENSCQAPEIPDVNKTETQQLQLYYKGWLYKTPDPESKQIQSYSDAHQFDWCPCGAHQCPVRKNLPQCPPRAKPEVCAAKDDELGICPARYDRGMCPARYDREMCPARYDRGTCNRRSNQGVCLPRWRNEMCEARVWEECEWPWLKRIGVFERHDKCKYDLPVCDWPLVKRIQIYESKELCKYDWPTCDWPLVKRIQVYSRGDRCAFLTLPECDWPYLKQIKQYEGKGRCYQNDRLQCEWNGCVAWHYQECKWSRLDEAQERGTGSPSPPA